MRSSSTQMYARGESERGSADPPRFEGYFYYRIKDGRIRNVLADRDSLPDCLDPRQQKAVLALRQANRTSLKDWFSRLSPPNLATLSGEFDAALLDQGGAVRDTLTAQMFGMHGTWLGKAFHPSGAGAGVGYNYFDDGGSILRKLPMDTSIEPSRIDHRHSMFLRYSAKNQGLIRWLVGEIRQVVPGVLLGIGVIGPATFRRMIPFALYGPCREYHHESERVARVG